MDCVRAASPSRLADAPVLDVKTAEDAAEAERLAQRCPQPRRSLREPQLSERRVHSLRDQFANRFAHSGVLGRFVRRFRPERLIY
jgi:hypothetical protein